MVDLWAGLLALIESKFGSIVMILVRPGSTGQFDDYESSFPLAIITINNQSYRCWLIKADLTIAFSYFVAILPIKGEGDKARVKKV